MHTILYLNPKYVKRVSESSGTHTSTTSNAPIPSVVDAGLDMKAEIARGLLGAALDASSCKA